MWISLTIKLLLPRLRHLDSGALKLDLVIYYTLRSGKSPHCFLVSIITTLDWNYVAKDKSSKLLTWITLPLHAIYCLDSPMWQIETEWGLQLLNLNMDYTKMLVRGHSVDPENNGRSRSPSSHNDNSVKATSSPEQWLTWARYFTQWKEIWEPDSRQCTKHIKLCSLMGCKTAGLYEGQHTWYMGVMPVPPASMPKAQTWLDLYLKRPYNSNTKGQIKLRKEPHKDFKTSKQSKLFKKTQKYHEDYWHSPQQYYK
jgi:hypothetical protein